MSADLAPAPCKPDSSASSRSLKRDLLAWAGLAVAVLAMLWPLGRKQPTAGGNG